tara:strand:- start:140 stop:724 length:585 start_codon:yes stop_codon:yes gene_type:complete
MQLIIISGQIGSGKTTISKLFHNKGYKLIDSDNLAKSIIQENEYVKKKINDVFKTDLSNKKYLSISSIRTQICKSKKNKEIIDGIVHPIFYNALNAILENNKEKQIVVEIPLIETLSNINYPFITVVVDSKLDIRMHRYEEKKSDDLDFFTIMNKYQKSRDYYINKADHIISNNDTIKKLKEEFNNLYNTLKNE